MRFVGVAVLCVSLLPFGVVAETAEKKRLDFDACVQNCVQRSCSNTATLQACESGCAQECSPVPILTDDRLGRLRESPVVTAEKEGPGESERLEKPDSMAFVVIALAMVTPAVIYALDQPPSEAQKKYHEGFRFDLGSGAGVAFPDSELLRVFGSAEWKVGSLGVDWSTWERGGLRNHRITSLFGFALPPRRHVELRLRGGPAWEGVDGEWKVGGLFSLASRFLLPHRFTLEMDSRVGGIAKKVVGELGFHVGIPLGDWVRFLLGGQVLFRGSEAAGGPEALFTFRY